MISLTSPAPEMTKVLDWTEAWTIRERWSGMNSMVVPYVEEGTNCDERGEL